MNISNWKETAELIGFAGIIVSLVFVGLQMKQAQDIASNEVSLGAFATGVEISNQMNEHADIWVRGSKGEELNEVERLIFANLMKNLNYEAFWHSSMRRQLGSDEPPREIFNFARRLHQNPGARQQWTDWQDAYQPYRTLRDRPLTAESFSGQVKEALEMMDEEVEDSVID